MPVLALFALLPAAASADGPPTYPSVGRQPLDRTVQRAPAIVGGGAITIAQAPWQVFVQARIPAGGGAYRTYSCGGSILSPTLVVTAGHCVFDEQTGAAIPAAELFVHAGSARVNEVDAADTSAPYGGVAVRVASVRVHPQYNYNASTSHVAPDDVATLQLASALTYRAGAIAPIGLVGAGAYPGGGTGGMLTGFGRETLDPAQQPDGLLYATTTSVVDPNVCAGADNAIITCVSSPVSSSCQGDSGGPLTIGGALQGVASFVASDGPSRQPCEPASTNGYTNLAAPEILAFVQGSDAPPLAPRGGSDTSMTGYSQARRSLVCSPGTWSNGPSFTISFVDTRNGEVLQSGPSGTYVLKDGDVGRTVACRVAAQNAGGIGISGTTATPAITPAPHVPAPSLRLSVRAAHKRGVAGGTMRYAIHLANRGDATATRVVVCEKAGRGLGLPRRTPRGAKRSKGKLCWSIRQLRPGKGVALRFTLRLAHARRTHTYASAVTVSARGIKASKHRVRLTVVARHRR